MNVLLSGPWDTYSEDLYRDLEQCRKLSLTEDVKEIEEEILDYYNYTHPNDYKKENT